MNGQKYKTILTNQQVQKYMKQALQQAKRGDKKQQVPVGCVFIDQNKKVVSRSHNLTNTFQNASRHCEINCINEMKQKKLNFQSLTLFVTVEPCIMCAHALNLVRIMKVYFGQYNSRFGGCGSVLKVYKYQFEGGILQKDSLQLLQKFYAKGNQRIPEQIRNKSRKKIKKQ